MVIGISATALFDLKEADSAFKDKRKNDPETAIQEYRDYMLERENDTLDEGTGYPLVKALLDLNQYKKKEDNAPLVEVVVLSRNSPENGVRVFNNIRRKGLRITRSAFTGGESVVNYLEAFEVDLFLTTNVDDDQKVIDSRNCAAALVREPPKGTNEIPEGQVRIAFDGDAVLFDDSSEIVYKTEGMERFHETEDSQQDVPMQEGPYGNLLKKLSSLQERLPFSVEFSPVRLAIVTARNAPAESRVIKTLRNWGLCIDEVFFLGGVEKSKILKAFKPHIFFDDQDVHLEKASQFVPSGKVPYTSDSPLNEKGEA